MSDYVAPYLLLIQRSKLKWYNWWQRMWINRLYSEMILRGLDYCSKPKEISYRKFYLMLKEID